MWKVTAHLYTDFGQCYCDLYTDLGQCYCDLCSYSKLDCVNKEIIEEGFLIPQNITWYSCNI